jgi:hypothetical protein
VAPYVTQPPPNGYYHVNDMGQSSPYGPPTGPPPDYQQTDTDHSMFGTRRSYRGHGRSHSGAAFASQSAAMAADSAGSANM